ncbi:MAG: thioredoxin [Firmicutes bacterium]|nr:thioredoxin [Bacillota bacterium]
MPILVDYRACDDSPACSAVRVCPKGALRFDRNKGKIVADNSKCTACSAPCTQVCPAGALKYYATMEELKKAETEISSSTLTKDDLLEQRYGLRPGDPRELGPNLYHVDCDNFTSDVLRSDVPVVVDFWAEWCAPCRVLAPTFKQMAAEYEGRMKFGKLDTEDCQEVPSRYGIMSIPTMLFFYNGEIIDWAVGALSREMLRRKIESVLARTAS